MTFDSLAFAAFMAVVFPVYAALQSWSARKNVLLVASIAFYGAWNPIFLLLLAFTTVFDWWAAQKIYAATDGAARKRWFLFSIIASLSLIGYFKYAQFFADAAVDLLAYCGVKFKPLDLGIILPLGISFYTFESISYITDVYRRRVTPTPSLRDYSLFMTFFPHLVAGPIMRFADFGIQVATPRRMTISGVSTGLFLAFAGLFLKIVAADQLFAPTANTVFSSDFHPDGGSAWLGACAFSMQVYCDFAGYSLTALGVAKMFGFDLPANFEAPFSSVGIAELWTRWHISLSNWLRDYVFNPLGHYRHGRWRGYLNVLITFTACGLWHGAAWHFVVWGALHGLMLIAERILKAHIGMWTIWRTFGARLVLSLLTFALFSFAVVFFRTPSLKQAWEHCLAMLGLAGTGTQILAWNGESITCLTALGIGLSMQQWLRTRRGWDWLVEIPWPLRSTAVCCMLVAVALCGGASAPFIYFQF
jgi:D-alanyl-lipoteichoic acid acyltransferase DltB (MBOAT superfamily)